LENEKAQDTLLSFRRNPLEDSRVRRLALALFDVLSEDVEGGKLLAPSLNKASR
jgi:hypothetical protein